MTEFFPPMLSLSEAMEQIERWAYENVLDDKKKVVKGPDGKTLRIPVPAKVKEHLEALVEQMDFEDWAKLANAYKEIALGKSFEEKRRRGRPPGPDYGLSVSERNQRKKERAKALGVWHVKYPDGCTECGGKQYAHASGGICSRCRSILRNAGISIKEFRKMKLEGVSNDSEPKGSVAVGSNDNVHSESVSRNAELGNFLT